MGDSRPYRPGCDSHYFSFFFSQECYGWSQKNDLHEFSHFFENFSGSNGRNRCEIRAVIDTFWTYTINSLMKKKISETNSIMSRALFWVAQPKFKKIKMIFLPTSLQWQHSLRVNSFLKFFFQLYLQNFFPTFFFIKFCFSKFRFLIFFINFFFQNFIFQFFYFLIEEAMFSWKKVMILASEYSE